MASKIYNTHYTFTKVRIDRHYQKMARGQFGYSYYVEGCLHRIADDPSVVCGGKYWFKYGVHHRDELPAVYSGGFRHWYYRGQLMKSEC